MKIDISKTENQVGESFEANISEDLPNFEYGGAEYVFSKPVEFNGIYLVEEHGVGVIGKVSATLKTACAKCLGDAEIKLKINMNEAFRLEPKDEDTYQFSGHIVDIEKAVMDNIALNLPLYVTCKDDCKGLCPHCGIDLNKDTCTCEIDEKKASSPFSKLNDMFSDDSKG